MTRQHFKAIAEGLLASRPRQGAGPEVMRQWRDTVNEVTARIAVFNPNFNYPRFHEACGYDDLVEWLSAEGGA